MTRGTNPQRATRALQGLAILLMAAGLAAQSPDEERSAWQYRRAVTPPDGSSGTVIAIAIPPDVQSRSQPGLRDLRLVDEGGREVPFLIQEDVPRTAGERWSGRLSGAEHERRDYTTWVVDFGGPIAFDRIMLDAPAVDFAKRFSIDVSPDGAAWRELGRDFWIFDREWQAERVHETTIDVPGTEGRYVRLQADDSRSSPIGLRAVSAERSRQLAGSAWSEDVALEPITSENGRSRYRVALADGHPVRRLALDADDAAFARRVTVFERARDGERPVGGALLYRLNLPGEAGDFDARALDVIRRQTGPLEIEIADGDNPPLRNPRVRVSGPGTLLLTTASGSALTLYYGNPVTRAAVYELEPFRTALAGVPDFPAATLGPEGSNPRFRQPAPLAFVAARGATVAARDWRFSRPVVVSGSDDLYTMTIPAADLPRLKADLGDLRLVDENDRQLPYVLERDAAVTHVAMTVTPANPRGGRRQTSALRLGLGGEGSTSAPNRLSALRLQVAEPFFQRRAVVLQPRSDAPLGAIEVTQALLASSDRRSTGPVWVEVSLPPVAASELIVEIADGDNAPLSVLQAQAAVRVPRVTFKAGVGTYRLLLGNSAATAPSYELGALRQEVLAYAAVPLELPDSVDTASNPAYEPGVAGFIRDAPPRAVLWSALGVAIAALLVLTRRILSRPAGPDDAA